MPKIHLVILSGVAAVCAWPVMAKIKAIHSLSESTRIERRTDGSFDVTCLDGNTEIRTQNQIMANEVCTHLQSFTSEKRLERGGYADGARLCDFRVSGIKSTDKVWSATIGFLPPCPEDAAPATCDNKSVCHVTLQGKDFLISLGADPIEMTRVSDKLTGYYGGGIGSGRVRATTMNGVNNVLQVFNGSQWKSVCDDGFTQMAADVVCREMGYQSAAFSTGVYVSGDTDFGFDEVSCRGTESSLWDCGHSNWGVHNCDSSEHVTVTCR